MNYKIQQYLRDDFSFQKKKKVMRIHILNLPRRHSSITYLHSSDSPLLYTCEIYSLAIYILQWVAAKPNYLLLFKWQDFQTWESIWQYSGIIRTMAKGTLEFKIRKAPIFCWVWRIIYWHRCRISGTRILQSIHMS